MEKQGEEEVVRGKKKVFLQRSLPRVLFSFFGVAPPPSHRVSELSTLRIPIPSLRNRVADNAYLAIDAARTEATPPA